MLITKLEHEYFDEGQQDQEKGDLSLNLNCFQTEGTNVYDFGSYVKVHKVPGTINEIMNSQRESVTESGDKHIGWSKRRH